MREVWRIGGALHHRDQATNNGQVSPEPRAAPPLRRARAKSRIGWSSIARAVRSHLAMRLSVGDRDTDLRSVCVRVWQQAPRARCHRPGTNAD
jgi:hypothetical protein